MKIINDGWRVGRGWSNIDHNHEYDYDTGVVVTPHGIVSVYAQGSDKYIHTSWIGFAFHGRWHCRRFHGKRYTPRGLARKARQFAREIAEGEADAH